MRKASKFSKWGEVSGMTYHCFVILNQTAYPHYTYHVHLFTECRDPLSVSEMAADIVREKCSAVTAPKYVAVEELPFSVAESHCVIPMIYGENPINKVPEEDIKRIEEYRKTKLTVECTEEGAVNAFKFIEKYKVDFKCYRLGNKYQIEIYKRFNDFREYLNLAKEAGTEAGIRENDYTYIAFYSLNFLVNSLAHEAHYFSGNSIKSYCREQINPEEVIGFAERLASKYLPPLTLSVGKIKVRTGAFRSIYFEGPAMELRDIDRIMREVEEKHGLNHYVLSTKNPMKYGKVDLGEITIVAEGKIVSVYTRNELNEQELAKIREYAEKKFIDHERVILEAYNRISVKLAEIVKECEITAEGNTAIIRVPEKHANAAGKLIGKGGWVVSKVQEETGLRVKIVTAERSIDELSRKLAELKKAFTQLPQ
jgi:hypothetical protein